MVVKFPFNVVKMRENTSRCPPTPKCGKGYTKQQIKRNVPMFQNSDRDARGSLKLNRVFCRNKSRQHCTKSTRVEGIRKSRNS